MKTELRNQYETEKIVDFLLVCADKMGANDDENSNTNQIKMIHLKGIFDDNGFCPLQIKTYSDNEGVKAAIVHGRHMNGLGQIYVYEVGSRFYPFVATVESLTDDLDILKENESAYGLEGISMRIKEVLEQQSVADGEE